MIYRLRYCNKDGVEARVDIQKGSSTPVIEVEGTERPFILSYNNDKGNKSGMFLSSSADIEIYETTDFNINNLKTSNETELSVTHYINNVISWKGFIIPDFFSIEVRNNPVITMTASDRLGTLKNVTLADLPSMISLRELAILCLNKTGLSLPLRTMADFNNGTGVNDFFNSKILTQRLSDTKGRSISCYDILSSILTASNSFLVQRSGGWHIINKIQHEAGSGKLYTGATSFINWSDVIFNFSDISIGGRRTIIPVASTVGVFHEFGGGRLHPENYDFLHDLTGWNPVGGFVATIDNRSVDTFTTGASGGAIISPVYGDATEKKYLVNNNEYVRNVNPIYLESDPIPIFYKGPGAVNISLDINAVGPSASSAYIRVAIIATNGTDTKILDYSGNFIDYPDVNPPVFTTQFNDELAIAPTILKALSKGLAVSGTLEVEDDLSLYSLKIRLYGGGGGRYVLINSASVIVKSGANDNAKGIIYKVEREDNYTKAHDIDTSLFADYLTTGLNGYFYSFPIDDTSLIYNSNNELTSKWTAYNDPEQLPLLQHVTRQKSRLFSVAHDLLSAEIEASNFDPLAIFVACEKRYTVVSAQFDFFKSNLSVELEEVAFQNASVRDFIYSYFGDGESGIKSIGGISGGSGGGGTGGGLTPEQIEILSFWKKDPDRENTIFTEMNAYSKLELSAYGAGDGGGGGGSDYERLDTWADYDSSKAEWVLSAFLGNDLNTRVTNLEQSSGGGGEILSFVTSGTGNAVTSIAKSGTVVTAYKSGSFLPLTGGTMSNTNLVTNLNADLLDGKYGYQYRGELDLGSLIDYEQAVIALVNLDNSNPYRDEWAYGQMTNKRNNGISWSGGVTNFAVQKKYDSTSMDGYLDTTASGIQLCTFTYNGTKYGGIRYYPSASVSYGNNFMYYRGAGITPFMVKYRNNSGALNAEVDSSLVIEGADVSIKRLRTGSNIYAFTSDNVASATKLETPRTIAGVSFDGTANIAIPFANLSSKPTTLGGYEITDAVTLNTAQTITGAKTFSSNLYTTANLIANTGITIAQSAGTGVGLSLNGAAGADTSTNPIYGLMFAATANKGTHGSVTGTWATYFTMNTSAGRGWIFTTDPVGTGGNVASISNTGDITANGYLSTPKVIFNSAGWSMEQVGSELQMKHNNILKMRFTSTGSIVATNEITAFG